MLPINQYNAGFRIASGAFKSSPIPSLLVDAGELPLDFYRQMLLAQYWHRVQRIPSSLASQAILNDKFFKFYDNHPRCPKPFGYRAFKLFEELCIPRMKVHPFKYSVVPPWKLPSVEHCEWYLGKTHDMGDEILRLSFLKHLEDHHNSAMVFTNGSKSSAGVGFGAIFPDFNRSGRLLDQSSIFTAEAYAILTALKEISSRQKGKYVIFSDSQSTLLALENFNSNHPIIVEILEWLYLTEANGCSISFCWSPAHVGIVGNEKADALAKAASTSVSIIQHPLPVNDTKPIIRSTVFSSWQFFWDLENQKMKEIAVSIKPWKYSPMIRRKEVVLSRLRIGHTRLTHGFLMNKEPQPFCEDCLVPLTVRHLLAECPSLLDARNKYFSGCKANDGSFMLSRILGFDFKEDCLFNFIKEVGLLGNI